MGDLPLTNDRFFFDRQVKKSKSRIIWMSLVLPDDGEITQFQFLFILITSHSHPLTHSTCLLILFFYFFIFLYFISTPNSNSVSRGSMILVSFYFYFEKVIELNDALPMISAVQASRLSPTKGGRGDCSSKLLFFITHVSSGNSSISSRNSNSSSSSSSSI